jgi:type IV secretory pathway TrbL component
MKIPEPIIEPATSIVASIRVIALTNSGFDCCVGIVDPEPVFGAATLVIRLLVIARNRDHQAADGMVCRKPVKNRAIMSGALLAASLSERAATTSTLPAILAT